MDLLRWENHFNVIKVHYLSHLSSQVRRFGSISKYSTVISELAHNDEIKEGYCRSNKNQATHQILSHYDCQHILGIRLQTLDILLKGENLVAMEDTSREAPAAPERMIKDRDQEWQQAERALQNLQPRSRGHNRGDVRFYEVNCTG